MKSMAQPYKTKVLKKKMIEFFCWWYRGWWQSYRGMTREVPKCPFLLYESKEGPKKGADRQRKMAKNTKVRTKRSSVGHFETSPIPKCTVFKTVHARYRDIAPKPIKWWFKNDFADHFFPIFFQNFGPMDTK